jgi:glutamate 5-kinase
LLNEKQASAQNFETFQQLQKQLNELRMAEGNANGVGGLDSTRVAHELASSSTKRRIAELVALEQRLKTEGP